MRSTQERHSKTQDREGTARPSGNAEPAAEQALPPFPEGWFFVASRRAVLKAGLIQKQWMGKNIVVWCDEEGRACVAEAVCPHLGSDLGPDAGGRVCDGRLVCPFHGFEFDAAGQCVATPFAAPPRSARLRVFETQEVCGLLFAWWGIGDRKPQWRLPGRALAEAGWSGMETWTVAFPRPSPGDDGKLRGHYPPQLRARL